MFLDLGFVQSIAKLGSQMEEDHIDLTLYLCAFLNLYNYWREIVSYSCRFETDDWYHKVLFSAFLLIMLCGGMDMTGGLDDEGHGEMLAWASLQTLICVNWLRVVRRRDFKTGEGKLKE